jgi:hypothetical protein
MRQDAITKGTTDPASPSNNPISSRGRAGDMYHRYRVPIFIASVLFMVGSLLVVLHGLPAAAIEGPPPPTERERAEYLARAAAYALRCRNDAFEHLAKGDFEVAETRLDEAKEWDPKTDRESPEVQRARHVIAENLGSPEPETEASSPSTPPSQSPSPGDAGRE